jgi:hypothetical protein
MLRTLLALASLVLYWWLCLLRAACALVVTVSNTIVITTLIPFICHNLGRIRWVVTVH